MPVSRRYAVFSAVIIPLALALFCGKGSNNPAAVQENGMLEIRARVVNKALAKSGAAATTVAERLVVEISANDMETMRIERKLDLSRPSVGDTLTKIPPGKNRRVKIWAIDKNDVVTHIDSIENRNTVNIEDKTVTLIYATLIPAAGSIYLQFLGLPANSSVYARFASSDETFSVENSVNRSTRTFLNLDNIPHRTAGILTAFIIDGSGNTLYVAQRELTFDARSDNTIDLEFNESGGKMAVNVAVYNPGVTVGSYDYTKKSESIVVETGELIITEIMWNASNDNYIELYNPQAEAVSFEVLTTDVDGTMYDFTDVTVAANGYFVIGRQKLPYVNVNTPTTGGLSITSTGNWITIKRGKNGPVIDRVICAGSNNATGWPPVSGKRSIELARDKYSVTDNNYGKNWSAAVEFINEESSQYGTPGR
jgi:hypothetical protein